MFSKGSKTADTAPAVETPGGSQRRDSKAGGVPSIVSPDLKIHGNLSSEGDIQVDGTVEGDVVAGNLTIGEHGAIYGKIEAKTVRVRGTVKGEVHGESVTLLSSARVHGDVVHASLSIEAGAWLEGHCRRQSEQKAGARTSAPADGAGKTRRGTNGSGAATAGATADGAEGVQVGAEAGQTAAKDVKSK